MSHETSAVEQLLLNSPVKGHEGQCLVCYSPLEYPTLTPCGHDEVCGTCHLRLRFLHGDKKCPMCKSLNEQLICDYSTNRKESFQAYPLWGNELGGDFHYRANVGMFFPMEYYESEIEPLFGYQCLECNDYDGTTVDDDNIYQQPQTKRTKQKQITPLGGLLNHLRNTHRLTLCQLCVNHKRDFVSALPRYTPAQLKHHLQHGDGQGNRGHPLCEFCRPTRFYDLHELHTHLARDHYKCHVCDKQGLANQYFRNYESLERHFELQHFLCPDVQCRAARFVVFENDIDLRGHELSTHGATSSGSTKIQLEFRYRRSNEQEQQQQQDVPLAHDFEYGVDGQAFCPQVEEMNPNTHGAPNQDTSHPLHLQRTNELRAHAAEIRTRRQLQEAPEAFPSLQRNRDNASASASGALRVGWSSGASSSIGRKSEMAAENFPSLPTSGNVAKNSLRAKLKSGSGGVSSNRTFAAMQSAATHPSSSGWNGGGTTTTATSSSSFPSLSSSSTIQSSVASRIGNRESNLTQDNFPSLGGMSSSTPRYVAMENLARTKKATPASFTNSAVDFPPPPSAKPAARSIRRELLAPPTRPPPAVDNVLDFPPPPSTQVTVDEIKATLGSQKYKELKRLTKEFAADAIAPDAYVDHAASLFEQGYADANFWSFLPSLLQSCPNTASANRAQEYMQQLRRNQASVAGASSATSHVGASMASGTTWSNMPPKVTAVASAPRKPSATSTLHTSWSSNTASTARATKPTNKAAWNAGSTSSVARAKQKPGSVTAAAAAAQETSKQSTATKYMADQAKKNKKQDTKKAKKKQNDELRALAFGGK